MFLSINKSFIIFTLLTLDILLVLSIQNNIYAKNTNIEKPKTVRVSEKTDSNLAFARTTIPKAPPSSAPTLTPTNTPAPKSQTQTNTQEVKGDIDILNKVNEFRVSRGLSPVATDPYTCSFAQLRAGEITSAFNHDGFSNRVNSKTLPYPGYSEIVENIAEGSNPENIVPNWIASPGHNENMLKNTPYGCIGQSGRFYVYEAWRP